MPKRRESFNQAATSSVGALQGRIGRVQFIALGFGTVVGSAWIAILGNWLTSAGPGGTALGLIAGGFSIALIGLCYAELTTRIPEAGGEFIYALKIFGPRVAFAVAWTLLLMLAAIMVFEGIALAWFVTLLFPDAAFHTAYSLFNEELTLESLAIGVAGALIIAFMNWRGGTFSAQVHTALTALFLLGAVLLVILYAAHGSIDNLDPFWSRAKDSDWWKGSLWIFALSAVLLNGFQAIPHAVEERAPGLSLRAVAGTIVISILTAALFYVAIALSASAAVPWKQLASAELAVLEAAGQLPGGAALRNAVLLIGIVSLFKTWNGVALMASRLALAAARAGLFPAALSKIHPKHHSPTSAVLWLALLNVLGLFLGRGAIVPLLNAAAMGMTVVIVTTVVGLLVLRRRGNPAPYAVPGGSITIGFAAALASLMAVVAFAEPWRASNGVPLEWSLLFTWIAFGLLVQRRSA